MRDARKTIALRSPKATGYTPPSSLASNPCLNCGTNVQLNFCPECGQRAIDPDPTLREFLQELAAELLNWDGKLFTTFRLLVTQPGALTQEYLAGRRTRFISPLRLYLTCSVLFFFVKAVVPEAPTVVNGSAVRTTAGPITLEASDSASLKRYLDSAAKSSAPAKRAWGAHFSNALRNTADLSRSVTAALPRVMFVLVPLFAWLAAIVFRRQQMNYPQHLAFALHVHAYMFLALILTLAPRVITPNRVSHSGVWNALLVALGFSAIAWYLVQAVRRVYSTTLRGAVARSAALASTYFVAYVAALIVLFALVVLLQF